jgi:hypothetical protein
VIDPRRCVTVVEERDWKLREGHLQRIITEAGNGGSLVLPCVLWAKQTAQRRGETLAMRGCASTSRPCAPPTRFQQALPSF